MGNEQSSKQVYTVNVIDEYMKVTSDILQKHKKWILSLEKENANLKDRISKLEEEIKQMKSEKIN